MRRASSYALAFSCLLLAPVNTRAQTIVFQHVTVIDATGAPARRDLNVAIENGRITAVRKKIQIPRGARLVDASGKFVIPGLWDMHVHLSSPEVMLPLLVASGITGVREMYSGVAMSTIRQWRTFPDAPRIVAPGFLDGPLMLSNGPASPGAFAVSNAVEARIAVRILALSGVDFLKVYSGLPRDAYFAIAQESRTLGLPFVGHVPEGVSPLEASEAGQRSEEHLINILLACSTREDELRSERIATMNSPRLSAEERLRRLAWPQPEGLFDTYSEDKAAKLFRAFVANDTWQTPTLAILSGFAHAPDENVARDPRRRYLPETWTGAWDREQSPYLKDLSPEAYEAWTTRIRTLLGRYKKLVGDMRRVGVSFLAGTDSARGNPLFPGWSLHEELALLAGAGLTPMEALQSATINPAKYFGTIAGAGTIEEGKGADLVFLDADPLRDIRNTQKIRAVVMRGKYYSRQDLDAMLDRAANAAQAVH